MDIQNFDQGNSLQQHAEKGYDGGSFESKMDYDITGSTEASLEWVHDSGANSGVLKDKTLLLDKNPGFTKLDDSGKTVHASFLGELKRRSVVHVGAS